jgi:hypothetical protein
MKSRRMRPEERVACISGISNIYNILVGKIEENRLLGDLKLTRTDTIKR